MTTATRPRFADAVAEFITNAMFPPHRGVIEVKNPHDGCPRIVIFGNDGYRDDDRTKRYADDLLRQLEDDGWQPEFGVDQEGYTWAIVLGETYADDTVQFLTAMFHEKLYNCYTRARGLSRDDGTVLVMASIHRRETIQHTNGLPIVVPGWESLN